MSESLTIAVCLRLAQQLTAVSESPRLDIEILLAHILQKERTFLFTWPETALTREQEDQFTAAFERRLGGEPVAHIIGQREFWSLPLFVNNTTLIPRPDTELLVETILNLFASDMHNQPRQVLDLGTGTGAIVLALAHEKKHWHCLGVDNQPDAVQLAQRNRDHLQLHNVTIRQSDWFTAVDQTDFDVIVSNPPYIAADDPHLQQGDVRFEPLSALVADNQGFRDIENIVQQAKHYLLPNGWLLIEHGYQQGLAVRRLFEQSGYAAIQTLSDLGGNERVTLGKKAG
ncbi:MAG: peptide chain release factor N(5)-glutamine methyltransferase [Cellvibrio sp.]|jgi:protein-(glutamine-N5) methyltransferase, release factor-specific